MTPRALVLVIAVVAFCAGCDVEQLSSAVCPPGGTTLTYQDFGQAFFAARCNGCHAAAVTDREGAPDDFVFDTLAEIRAHRDRIYARAAGDNDSMPPGPDDPPLAEREELAEWLACGAP